MSLLAELKRRNVIRMAGLYLVGAWLLTQVASTVLPAFDVPAWTLRALIIVLALGFVPALIFAWAFELTPAGFKRDAEVNPQESIAPQTARRLDRMIIAVLICAVIYFGVDKFLLEPRREAALVLQVQQSVKGESGSDGAKSDDGRPDAGKTDGAKSIAVLPFNDMSPAHDQEYFSDGMAEEILNALAQVQDLKVAGRTSSFYFKGRNEKLPAIGAALGVANVLEGSVRKQGNKVRITAQLIHAADGFHLWSQTYDGELTDVFELQERIARAITDALKVVLEGDPNARLAPPTTHSIAAYEQFLRGRYFFTRRGYKNLQDAIAAYKAALATDPGYADAWAGLAQTYAVFSEYTSIDPDSKGREDTSVQALEAAETALKLDAGSSAALLARAYVRCVIQFDWAAAEADYRAALARNPRDATAHQWYGEFFIYQQRWREAIDQLDRGIALDPLAPIIQQARAVAADASGDFEGALPFVRESLRLAPGFYNAAIEEVEDLVELGRLDEAAAKVQELASERRTPLLAMIAALRDPTQTDAAVGALLKNPLDSTDQAWAFVKLGKFDLALADLERVFRERDPVRIYLYTMHAFNVLHADPRFDALRRQLKLPAPAVDKPTAQP